MKQLDKTKGIETNKNMHIAPGIRPTSFRKIEVLFAQVRDKAKQRNPSSQYAQHDVEVCDCQGRHLLAEKIKLSDPCKSEPQDDIKRTKRPRGSSE